MRVAARVPAEVEAQCAALAARGGLGPPPPGALADDPLPLPDPAAPGWAGADADGAADGGEFEELATRCCPISKPFPDFQAVSHQGLHVRSQANAVKERTALSRDSTSLPAHIVGVAVVCPDTMAEPGLCWSYACSSS